MCRMSSSPTSRLPLLAVGTPLYWVGERELSHHTPTGVRAYAIDPVASGRGFDLRYDGAAGVTLPGEPQLLVVNLVRSNDS